MEQNIRIKETANRRLLDVNAAFICLYSTHFIPSKLPPRVWWARQYCTQNNNRNPAMWLLEETCVQKVVSLNLSTGVTGWIFFT